MVTMTATGLGRPPTGDLVVFEGPYTVADRDAVPDNGYRHELLDGMLVMSAAPRLRHQDVVLGLATLLKEAAPGHLKVVLAPFDVRHGEGTAIQPDIVVARRDGVDEGGWTHRPLLCVEVASPATRVLDLGRKMDVLAEIGCPSYWTIEPDAGPELTVWELRAGDYVVVDRAVGDEELTTWHPFEVTVVPTELLDD